MTIRNIDELEKTINSAMASVEITDIHTHLFSTDFGDLLLWGIDDQLTFHYLVSETMRWLDMPYETFWGMSKKEQADLVWDTLFVKNTPYSEACRGVLTVLKNLGLDVESRNIDDYREYFNTLNADQYIDKIFQLTGVKTLIMTNDPFEDTEREVWLKSYKGDKRFRAALRIDPLLNNWSGSCLKLKQWGYTVSEELTDETLKEIRRFLSDWIDRMGALYMAASLPPSFKVPEESPRSKIVEECIVPVSREKNVPFAMMIGVKKLVNPDLRLAGDSVGKGDINTVEYLCSKYPQNKFMLTMLSRENQHELCVVARKFRNLFIFGCWWFLNTPVIIEEMTRMRFELLGSSFLPQHSDCRVLDQLIYKWEHSKKIIGKVLLDKYSDIMSTGWVIEEEEIIRDINKLFGGNFWEFMERKII